MQKKWLRSLQGLALVSAVVVLTGAKGQGCGGGSDSGTGGSATGDPPIVCFGPLHAESVCDGHGDCDQAGCHDACVPDCTDGTEPVYVCPPTPICPPGQVCNGPDQPACGYTCQPLDPCGKGFHQEEICEGTGTSTVTPVDDGTDTSGTSPGSPPNPGGPDCNVECVPDDVCPPGYVEETVCAGSSGGSKSGKKGAPNDSCWTECVDESTTDTITSTSWSSSSWTSTSSSSDGGWQPF